MSSKRPSSPIRPFSRTLKIWMCVIISILKSPLSVIRSQTYIAKSKAPLLINSCEEDGAFPKPFAEAADQKFANFAPGYRRTYYEGASHGFAVRGDVVRENVFLVTLSRCSFYTPCPEQAGGEGRQGRRFQGERSMADQIPAVDRCRRRYIDVFGEREMKTCTAKCCVDCYL